MVINHLLTGMILQVVMRNESRIRGENESLTTMA